MKNLTDIIEISTPILAGAIALGTSVWYEITTNRIKHTAVEADFIFKEEDVPIEYVRPFITISIDINESKGQRKSFINGEKETMVESEYPIGLSTCSGW